MDENLAGERFATFRDAFAEFLQSCPDRRIVRMGQKVSLIDQFEINHEDDDDHSRKEVNFEQIDFAINALMRSVHVVYRVRAAKCLTLIYFIRYVR